MNAKEKVQKPNQVVEIDAFANALNECDKVAIGRPSIPKINIRHADKTKPKPKPNAVDTNYNSMPDLLPLSTEIDKFVRMTPIKINIVVAHPNDPTYGEVRNIEIKRKKRGKQMAHASTQTINGNLRAFDEPIDIGKYVRYGLEVFLSQVDVLRFKGQDQPCSLSYLHMPHGYPLSALHFGVGLPVAAEAPKRKQAKSSVPTGNKNAECSVVSTSADIPSTSNGAEPKKSLVPSGAVEPQPLWKKQDVSKLGQFKDRYDFPQKKRYVVDREKLEDEDARMLQLNELERERQEIEHLRYDDDLDIFGDLILDDADSVESSADADFSDEEGAIPNRPKKTEDEIAKLLETEEFDENQLFLPEGDLEPEKPKLKKQKQTHTEKNDDEISLAPSSSFG